LFCFHCQSLRKSSLVNFVGGLFKRLQWGLNEKQNAGNYSVDFDASNYPSGIYYYKLTAGFQSEVKKMLLIK
jgi:hypothetical protein